MTPWPKRNKFRAQKTPDGCGSRLESSVLDYLKKREFLGEIGNIQQQAKVFLSAASIGYRADFKFTIKATGETVWAEAKGLELEGWRLKKKLWSCYGPGRLEIYKGTYQKIRLDEVLVPKPKALICPGCGVAVEEK